MTTELCHLKWVWWQSHPRQLPIVFDTQASPWQVILNHQKRPTMTMMTTNMTFHRFSLIRLVSTAVIAFETWHLMTYVTVEYHMINADHCPNHDRQWDFSSCHREEWSRMCSFTKFEIYFLNLSTSDTLELRITRTFYDGPSNFELTRL